MIEGIRHRAWHQVTFWSFDTEEEARGSGFYPLEVITVVLALNCRLPKQGCRRPRCRQWAHVRGGKWNPRLPGAEMGDIAQAVFGLRRW